MPARAGLEGARQRARRLLEPSCEGFAALRHLGMDELVATSAAEYVDIALRLVDDAAWRTRMAQEIVQRRPALFDDRAGIRALEDALSKAAIAAA